MWLTRMSELFRFVYSGRHVTLHVKSNAEKVNSQAGYCCTLVPRLPFPVPGSPVPVPGISNILWKSHTFVALIRLSPNTHNLFTFNISEKSSNNSENWAYWEINTSGCRVTRSAATTLALFSHRKTKLVLARLKVHLQVCSHLIHLTPKSLFPRPKT